MNPRSRARTGGTMSDEEKRDDQEVEAHHGHGGRKPM